MWWLSFLLYLTILVAFSGGFWKDIWFALRKNSSHDDGSESLQTNKVTNAYLVTLVTELNNRTRWYSTEIWQVMFAYLGITGLAIDLTVGKGRIFTTYAFGASAILGLFVVWHMTRLRRSERRNIRNLARIEGKMGVPTANQAKVNAWPKPFQFAAIIIVVFYALVAVVSASGN